MMKLASPTWSSLKVIGNSYPAKASVIMPFLGYLIIFQQDFVRLVSSWSPFRDPFTEPSPVTHIGLNFYFLYFGLFIFGVGSFIFSVFCSSDVKRHADSDAFCVYAASTTTSDDIKNYCEYISANMGDESPDGKRAKLIVQSMSAGVQLNIPVESRLFAHKTYFSIKNKKFHLLRCFAFFSFAIGLTFLAIPSLIVFIKVCRMFFEQFF
jgi:hypothetical protein